MHRYCGSTFWDARITWNTNDPDFTECFEKTALLWSACAFLWLTAIYDVSILAGSNLWRKAAGYDLPSWRPAWTWMSILKLLNITLLIFLNVVILCVNWFQHSDNNNVSIFTVPSVHWITPLILIITHFISACLVVLHKARCVHTSGIQLIHWLLLSLVHALIFRTEYRNLDHPITPSLPLQGISLSLMLLQSFIFCWADIPQEDDSEDATTNLLIQSSDGVYREECPMIRASCLSYILFSWCTPLVRIGHKKPLTSRDLWHLIDSLSSSVVFNLFRKHYGTPRFGEIRSIYRNILKPIWSTCGRSFTLAFTCKLIDSLLAFLSPTLMGFLIDFVEDKEMETWKGCMWAVLLFLVTFVATIFFELYYLHIFKCFKNIHTCLDMIIYTKSLHISSEARKKKTVGEITNLMSVDVDAIGLLCYYTDSLWDSPIQIAVGITLLWKELGFAVFPGVGVIILLIPINWYLSARSAGYQKDQLKKKDERLKVIAEVLGGIQVIKLYAWEPSFLKQIWKIRAEEVNILRKRAFCQCALEFLSNSIPFLVSFVAFFTYVYMSGGVLNPKKAFTAVALFTLLTGPIQSLPSSISTLVDASVSFKRINDFLNAQEIQPDAVTFLPREDDDDGKAAAVKITNGTFSWEEITSSSSMWRLTDVNVEVETGSLTAIVGKVASGKSSLLSSMLGDMNKVSGQVTIRGKVAYVPQIAWILNATLRDNILFGLPYNRQKYAEIVECCGLGPDIDMLPAGDMTEIGEKGINLSGGQKQRVSLARAAYSEADVFLLDDVLSAVDAHVGKLIFDRLLGPSGHLQGKTRILCTHAYQFLPQVDRIVMLEEGRISSSGSYNQLTDKCDSFANLMSVYTRSKDEYRQGKSTRSKETCTSCPTDNEDDMEKDAKKKMEGKLIEEELLETGDVKMSVFKAYLKAMGYSFVICVVLFFGFAEALSLARNIVLSKWTSTASAATSTNSTYHHHDPGTTTAFAWGYAVLGIMECLFFLAAYLLLTIISLRATSTLHNQMLQRILQAPMKFFNVTPVGRITNRFSKDVNTVDKELRGHLGQWVSHVYKFLGIVTAIIFATNLYFVLYIIPLTVVYYILQRYYVLCMQQLQRIMNSLHSPIQSQFQETLNGTSTIRAYKAEPLFTQIMGEKINDLSRAYFPHLIVRRWLSIRLGALGATVVFIPAIFAVIWRDTMDPSLVGLSVSYAVQVTGIISWLIKVTSYLQYNFVSVERILEYAEVDQEADFDKGRKECPKNWPEKGDINFINYETRYRPGLDLVLRQFTCRVLPREKIGVVGRTGAGKSSLTLAIFRIVEAVGGQIQIDGVDIADLGLHQVRKRLTVIPQDPVLFSRTLRLNLDPFDEYTDDKIWEALKMAHLKKFVDELGEGLDYLVAEGGDNLSVGQRQLVCLARAILRKSSILILDEATASVDSVTDELIQKTIREHFFDCTILNVAHRLNTVLDSSRILVLNRGEIIEFDTPQKLLADPTSHFYGMARDAGINTQL